MSAELVKTLLDNKLTAATAESCTGGLLAKLITDRPGASACFGMGVVTYSNEAKRKLLGVNEQTLQQHGAVSRETAAQMCEGALKLSGADIAIAVTGIAGPQGGTPQKPVGRVYIGITGRIGTRVSEHNLKGTREQIRQQTAELAASEAAGYARSTAHSV